MKTFVFAAIAMVAVSLGLAAVQPANAARGYGQQQGDRGVCPRWHRVGASIWAATERFAREGQRRWGGPASPPWLFLFNHLAR